jgi:hypothetical protein
MPLNRTEGELLDGVWPGNPADYRIVRTDDWAGRPEFKEACEFAAKQLIRAGAGRPLRFMPDDVLIQQYPAHGPAKKIAFIFAKPCRGGQARDDVKAIERFSIYTFDILHATHEGGIA